MVSRSVSIALIHAQHGILTVDADVRAAPDLVRSLLSHAIGTEVAATSIATTQRLSGVAEGIVHPALLTTLVYRFGIPGHTTRRVAAVQANGQCALYRREPLEQSGGFAAARASVCEDVTIARALATNGYAVGFHESDGLASVEMYSSWSDAWRNWTRSLPLRDQYAGLHGLAGIDRGRAGSGAATPDAAHAVAVRPSTAVCPNDQWHIGPGATWRAGWDRPCIYLAALDVLALAADRSASDRCSSGATHCDGRTSGAGELLIRGG